MDLPPEVGETNYYDIPSACLYTLMTVAMHQLLSNQYVNITTNQILHILDNSKTSLHVTNYAGHLHVGLGKKCNGCVTSEEPV